MSLRAVERLMFRLNSDAALAERFRADRSAVLQEVGSGLDDDERRWFEEGDVLSLYRHGVHPLLLVSASRMFGMDQPAYRAALAPARGERTG